MNVCPYEHMYMTDPLCVLLMYLRPAPSLSDHRNVQLLKDFKSAVREATTGRPEWTRQLDDVRNRLQQLSKTQSTEHHVMQFLLLELSITLFVTLFCLDFSRV